MGIPSEMEKHSGNMGEIYIEMVQGLGEALVGNYQGSPLRCVVMRAAVPRDGPLPAKALQTLAYPSKSLALRAAAGSAIFRSDSNAEDLPG